MKCRDQFVAGKEASAGAGPGTDERGLMQSSPQLQQQRAVLASLAVDPGMHHKYDDKKRMIPAKTDCVNIVVPNLVEDSHDQYMWLSAGLPLLLMPDFKPYSGTL